MFSNWRVIQYTYKIIAMKNYRIIYILILISVFISCNKDDDTEPEEKVQLVSIVTAETNQEIYKVELLSKDTLFEGYNILYFDIEKIETGVKLTNATVSLKPIMHMMMMSHTAPKENPLNTLNEDGYFEGAVVFVMPSNPNEGWTLDVAIESGGIKDTVTLVIPTVKSLEEPKKINIISQIDETKYFVSLVELANPIVGINNIEFTVHYKENMMSFPTAEDLTITIEPEMPSMDHGSPNNENPVHISNGHYMGKINFTMTGWWRVYITIKKGDELVGDDAYFDITL